MSFNKIAVLGLGKVGALAATLLRDSGFEVAGVDSRPIGADLPFPVESVDVAARPALGAALRRFEAVLSCLPYHLNADVARAAHEIGLHYFDLTEDVPTTKAIIELSRSAKGIMAPQCGLAPGFVGIVAADLAQKFDKCRTIRMRVGALPHNPTGLMGYAFNWSPEGVVNEYLNDCEVIEEGQHKWVSPMEWIETIYIGGIKLEAFTTSGGLGTMCETFRGKVDNLDYKTIRYPGHVKLMNFFFHELLMRERRKLAGEILTHAKPPVDDDIVFIHVSAEGTIDGALKRKEFVRAYRPIELAGARRTAIAWTTSSSAVAVIEMVREGALPPKGFLKQETVPLAPFLATTTGRLFQAGSPA
jgi:saccharopine dehydrogenase-like NADP-dependent oxidoreductase